MSLIQYHDSIVLFRLSRIIAVHRTINPSVLDSAIFNNIPTVIAAPLNTARILMKVELFILSVL